MALAPVKQNKETKSNAITLVIVDKMTKVIDTRSKVLKNVLVELNGNTLQVLCDIIKTEHKKIEEDLTKMSGTYVSAVKYLLITRILNAYNEYMTQFMVNQSLENFDAKPVELTFTEAELQVLKDLMMTAIELMEADRTKDLNEGTTLFSIDNYIILRQLHLEVRELVLGVRVD